MSSPISSRWLLLAILAVVGVGPSRQYVSVRLKNGTNSVGAKYEDNSFFTYHYANFPKSGKIKGFVWQWQWKRKSVPTNGCSYIPPLPDIEMNNSSKWFALIEDITHCEKTMLEHVRSAGFDLIVGYTTNSSSIPNIPKYLRKSEFPIVTITGDFANTLWESAATNSTTDAILVEVSVEDYDAILVGVSAGIVMFALVFCVLFCCAGYMRCRARRGRYTFPHRRQEQFNYQQFAQARLARRELIESILRQLQELQGEDRYHTPLGEAATKNLPQKKFAQAHRESSGGKETCAICVDEFEDKDMTRVLPCGHYFHTPCIDTWLTEYSSMCPLCKQSVSAEQEPAARQSSVQASDTTESYGTPELALTDVTNSPSPPRGHLSTNADDSVSTTSDTPLLGNGQPV